MLKLFSQQRVPTVLQILGVLLLILLFYKADKELSSFHTELQMLAKRSKEPGIAADKIPVTAVVKKHNNIIVSLQQNGKLNLQLYKVEVREVLQFLADKLQLNYLLLQAHNTDQKIEALELHDVSYKEAFEKIITLNNYNTRTENGVLLISAVAALEVKMIKLQYRNPQELAQLLLKNHQLFLSKHGEIIPDLNTNSLMIKDFAENISNLQQQINALDVASSQISINVRVIKINKSYISELGLSWDLVKKNIIDFKSPTVIDLELLEPKLSLFSAEGVLETLYNPRIVVNNYEHAHLEQGQSIPYQESNQYGATATSFKKAALGIDLTPQITSHDFIALDLSLTNNFANLQTTVNNYPIIETQEVHSKFIIQSGTTIVLGGVSSAMHMQNKQILPGMAKIPWIGALFKNAELNNSNSEFLIFVTATII